VPHVLRDVGPITNNEFRSRRWLANRSYVAGTYQRTDDVETLQDFVSARFADLTASSGLTDWARHALNAVTSAASAVRSAPTARPATSPRPAPLLIGADLPRISPGAERC
jgi:hypothetical protein